MMRSQDKHAMTKFIKAEREMTYPRLIFKQHRKHSDLIWYRSYGYLLHVVVVSWHLNAAWRMIFLCQTYGTQFRWRIIKWYVISCNGISLWYIVHQKTGVSSKSMWYLSNRANIDWFYEELAGINLGQHILNVLSLWNVYNKKRILIKKIAKTKKQQGISNGTVSTDCPKTSDKQDIT